MLGALSLGIARLFAPRLVARDIAEFSTVRYTGPPASPSVPLRRLTGLAN
jgi:hypothetical protein